MSKRLIIASVVTPLGVIPISAMYSLILWVNATPAEPNTLRFPDPYKPMDAILGYSVYGVPLAAVAMALFGLPAYLVAKSLGIASSWLALIVGVLAAQLPSFVAILFDTAPLTWAMYREWLIFSFMFGAPLGIFFWFMMSGEVRHRAA
jgi:hypothetical protein